MRSWCKLIIPSMTGEAASWKYNCHASGASQELTTRYRYMIKSVDGKEDTKSIVDFVNNKFLARDTRAFRAYLKELQPDMNMEFEWTNPQTGVKEGRPIPMGVGFFWPGE